MSESDLGSGRAQSVLMLCKGWPPAGGGVERYGFELSQAYVERGCSVTVLAPASNARTCAGVSLVAVEPGSQVLVAIRCLRLLRRILRGGDCPADPDLVHATTWRMALIAVLLRIHRRSRLVVSIHGREILMLNWPMQRLCRWVLRRASDRFAVSAYSSGRLLNSMGLSSYVAFNGTRRFERRSGASDIRRAVPRPVRVLTVCRLESRKNLERSIDAIQELSSRISIEYTIVGTGPLEQSLRSRIERAGLGHRISLTGFIPDVELVSLYRESDIFLHPQIALAGERDVEGFGLTVADAMAAGLPVVTGEAGAPAELVSGGDCGLIVDGKDVGQIARAIAVLAESESTRTELGARGQDFAREHLTWSRHADVILGRSQ